MNSTSNCCPQQNDDSGSSPILVFTNGIQDITAILPLLGSEQCETHVASGLSKGFLYPAASTMSIFGSLGVARAGFKTLFAATWLYFPKSKDGGGTDWRNWHCVPAAKILKHSGFKAEGTNLELIMLRKEDDAFCANGRIRDLLQKLHIDDDRETKIVSANLGWNVRMFIATAICCALSTTPYIHLNIDHGNRLALALRLAATGIRILGGFLTSTMIQLIIQYRTIDICQKAIDCRRQSGMSVTKSFHKLYTYSVRFLLLFGILCLLIGYVGAFVIVQNSSSSTNAAIWLGVEAALSVIRMMIWAINPSVDDAEPFLLEVKLDDHPTLPTCRADAVSIASDSTAVISEPHTDSASTAVITENPVGIKNVSTTRNSNPLLLTPAREFLESVISFAGMVEPFNPPNYTIYYTLTREQWPAADVPITSLDTSSVSERVLYITMYDHADRITTVYCKNHPDGKPHGHFYAAKTPKFDTKSGEQAKQETKLLSSIQPYDVSGMRTANFLIQLENHYESILTRIKARHDCSCDWASFKVDWAILNGEYVQLDISAKDATLRASPTADAPKRTLLKKLLSSSQRRVPRYSTTVWNDVNSIEGDIEKGSLSFEQRSLTSSSNSDSDDSFTESTVWQLEVLYKRFRNAPNKNLVCELISKRSLWLGGYAEWVYLEAGRISRSLLTESDRQNFLSFLRLLVMEHKEKELMLLYEIRILMHKLRCVLHAKGSTLSIADTAALKVMEVRKVDPVTLLMKTKLDHAHQAMTIRLARVEKALLSLLENMVLEPTSDPEWGEILLEVGERDLKTELDSLRTSIEDAWAVLRSIRYEGDMAEPQSDYHLDPLKIVFKQIDQEKWMKLQDDINTRLQSSRQRLLKRLSDIDLNNEFSKTFYWHYPLHRDLVECLYGTQKWIDFSLGYLHNDEDAALACSTNIRSLFLQISPCPKNEVAGDDIKSPDLNHFFERCDLSKTNISTINVEGGLTLDTVKIPENIICLNGKLLKENLAKLSSTDRSFIYFQGMTYMSTSRALCAKMGELAAFVVSFNGPSSGRLTLEVQHAVDTTGKLKIEGHKPVPIPARNYRTVSQTVFTFKQAPGLLQIPSTSLTRESEPSLSSQTVRKRPSISRTQSGLGAKLLRKATGGPEVQNIQTSPGDNANHSDNSITLEYKPGHRNTFLFSIIVENGSNYRLEDINLLLDCKPYNFNVIGPET